jgi:signal transduction histidine kinase
VTSWWRRRSLRTRLLVSSVIPLAAALVVGTLALAGIFAAGRVHEVDAQTKRQADVLVHLATTGQLPAPLPIPAGSTLLAQVVDDSGRVLASSASASRLLPLVTEPAPVLETVERPVFGEVPLRVRSARATVSGRRVWVIVAAPLGDVRRAVRALRLVLLVVVPLLVLAATLLARVLIGSALRPVERLRLSAVDILATRPDAGGVLTLPEHPDELQRLATTINDVLTRLQGIVAQQQSFVADAAHELRSPLASMRVQLDVARRHPGVVDAAVLVDELTPDLDRLTDLVDDLLLLARLEAGAGNRAARVDLAALAELTQPPVLVWGDAAALSRLLRNLRDNAVRHADRVQVSLSVDGGEAVLDVDDDGPGIAREHRDQVFERWFRIDSARGREEGGSGLGLALAREICTAHGGTIEVLDSPLGGARFRVRLPIAPDEGPR